jgi:acetate kinase
VIALALNAGSSTLKACLYEIEPSASLAAPVPPSWRRQLAWNPRNAGEDAAMRLVSELWEGRGPPLAAPNEIDVVGHRVVHGGTRFRAPTVVTSEVKQQIDALATLAPLHNHAALRAIEAIERSVPPGTPQIAVFDTAFHADLPPGAYTYAGPYEWLGDGLRRFGFHGINHHYVARRAAHLLGRDLESIRVLSCHLGSGGSLAAVSCGRSVDTTMGFTPLDGLAMATRSGSIDPGLLLHLLRSHRASADDLHEVLNQHSGLAGLSGTSGDMREVIAARERGEERAVLAFDVYIHRLRRCIGAMLPSLGGLDAIVFTGGVGENSPSVRREALAPFGFLGVELDDALNQRRDDDADISTADARVRTLVIAAREEWAIACSAAGLLTGIPA